MPLVLTVRREEGEICSAEAWIPESIDAMRLARKLACRCTMASFADIFSKGQKDE
jgi:hypothetical protein